MIRAFIFFLVIFGCVPAVKAGAFFYCTTNLDPNGDNWVALRSDPSTQTGYRIRKIGPGMSLDLLGWADHHRWAYVKMEDGAEGYINTHFIRKCAD